MRKMFFFAIVGTFFGPLNTFAFNSNKTAMPENFPKDDYITVSHLDADYATEWGYACVKRNPDLRCAEPWVFVVSDLNGEPKAELKWPVSQDQVGSKILQARNAAMDFIAECVSVEPYGTFTMNAASPSSSGIKVLGAVILDVLTSPEQLIIHAIQKKQARKDLARAADKLDQFLAKPMSASRRMRLLCPYMFTSPGA